MRRHGDRGDVAELVLDRPEAHNALSTAMARDIAAATAALAADDAVRAVVVSSASEKAFCVGADLKERNGFSDADLLAQRPHFRAAFGGILDLPVPTIAAVHGFALGGGLELALSCDLIVCDETAVLGLPEVTVGVIPGGGGTQLLTRRIGSSRAADLVFTGRRVDVEEADRLGLVDRRVAAGTDRDGGARAGRHHRGELAGGSTQRQAGVAARVRTSTSPPGWTSRTAPGARPRSPATGSRAWPRSTRSAAPTGRACEVREQHE